MSEQGEPSGELVERDDLFPEQEVDYVDPRKPVTARGVAIVSARVVTGLIGIGIAAATIAASALLPLPVIRAVPASTVVNPVPTAQQLVCPGAVLRLSDETGQGATTASAIGKPGTSYLSSTGSVDARPLSVSDASTGGTPAAPLVISTPPNQADPSQQLLLSGAQSQSVGEDEFVGLAAADCGVANGDSWLAGGATTVGRTTLLTLSNPTEVPATVNLELYGESGAISAPGTSGIIVPAAGQRVLSLAGFKPDIVSPIVHVSSSGGQVVASLQESIVRGLDAGGVDIIGATNPAGLVNVIPGMVVHNAAAVQALRGRGQAYDDVVPMLRLFAPGTGTVTTTVSVIPEDGAAGGTSFAYELEAGRVVDVPFSDLADGNYTVKIVSPVPVVAAARVTTAVIGGPTDFAWLPAAAELHGQAQLTAAPGPASALHVANTGTVDAALTLTAQDGGSRQLAVPAGSSALVAVQPGSSYRLSGFTSLFAAVTLVADGAIAGYTVSPPGAGSTPVTVYR
ncbi:hypothetical protein BH11ACT4_BH11ACT4_02340 [soil metagenome]